MPKTNEKQNISIAVLDEKFKNSDRKIDCLEVKVDLIMTNHLPHIQRSIAEIKTNQKVVLFILSAVAVAVIGLLIK
jgi:3-dehydroquinate dehydratase